MTLKLTNREASTEAGACRPACRIGGTIRPISPITQAVMATIRPLASAAGMKAAGGTSPRSGSCQRIRASKPASRPVASRTIGCRKQRELVLGQGPPQGALLREGGDRRVEIGSGGRDKRRRRLLPPPPSERGRVSRNRAMSPSRQRRRIGSAPASRWRICAAPTGTSTQSSSARTPAERGRASRMAISPKSSPAPAGRAPTRHRRAAGRSRCARSDQVGTVPDRPLLEQDGAGREGDGLGEILHRPGRCDVDGEGRATPGTAILRSDQGPAGSAARDPVGLDPRGERRRAQAEQLGRAARPGDPAARQGRAATISARSRARRSASVAARPPAPRPVRPGPWARSPRRRADRGGAGPRGEDHRPLDHVLQLADVAGQDSGRGGGHRPPRAAAPGR